MVTVNADDLTRDDSGYLYYQDKLFTGMMIWYYESGEIGRKFEYKDGYQHGWSRFFFESGQLRNERYYQKGRLAGFKRLYYENGQLEYEAEIHRGRETWAKEWSIDGTLTRDYKGELL